MSAEARTTPYIPGELTDTIIVKVEDRPTLCACALVCRDWLPTSRRTLLRSVRLEGTRQALSFLQHVVRNTDMAALLSGSMEGFAWVEPKSEPERVTEVSEVSLPPIWLQNPLFELAGRLPNLQYLSLGSAKWDVLPPHPRSYLALSQFPSLTEILFHYCRLPSFHILRRILVSVHRLKRLELIHVSWPRGPPNTLLQDLTRRYPHGRLRLESLRIDLADEADADSMLGQFLSWLAQTSTTTSLHSLEQRYHDVFSSFNILRSLGQSYDDATSPAVNVQSLTPWGVPMRTHYAQILAPFETMTHLELSGDVEVSAAYALASFKNLKKLTITCAHNKDGSYWTKIVHVLEGVVSMLDILELHLLPSLDDVATAAAFVKHLEKLDMLDTVLERTCFERLSTFGLRAWLLIQGEGKSAEEEEIITTIRRQLPTLHGRERNPLRILII